MTDYLEGKAQKVAFFTFYSLTNNPFSFSQGYCIAFNSHALMQSNVFVLVGIDREGGKIETKKITIK